MERVSSDLWHVESMERQLRQMFEENYELLRAEGSGSLTPEAKEAAFNQVLLYWRKLQHVAERVTETEVQLSLPGQRSPQGREFTIEGVVDIVRDEEQTVMYDIKTHDADYVRANPDSYAQQLNVYAHIWQSLRGQPLDEAAIVATRYPSRVKRALERGDEKYLELCLARWDPLVQISFDQEDVEETIAEFGTVVDAIEDGAFAPRDTATLESRVGQSGRPFASDVCGYCDARYSCASYRQFAERTRTPDAPVWELLRGEVPADDQEEWRTYNLAAAQDLDELAEDFVD